MARKNQDRRKNTAPQQGARPAKAAPDAGFLAQPRNAAVLAMAVALVLRILAALNIPSITYDGTFYLRQAMRIVQGTYRFESFPPGLPLLVAPWGAIGLDYETVAMLINLLAGVASVGLLFLLAQRHVGAPAAFVLALLLALHPAFIRVQVEVLSEPVYMVTLLAAFLLYERNRLTWCGAVLGYAFLLRPESFVLLPGLAVAHFLQHRRVPWTMLLVGLLPVAAFSFFSSREIGRFVITAKQGQFDLDADVWERTKIAFKTLHSVFPVALVPIALIEGVRRRSLFVLPVLYLLVLPFYDIHIQHRLHLPAVLFLAILSVMWLQNQTPNVRKFGIVAALGLLVWGTMPSTRSFFERSIVLDHARQIGERLQPHLEFDDKVAGRFPFIPYYGGAGFVRVENLSYESIMDSIQAEGATHLLLMENEAINVRPQLRDLFENEAFARTESRLRLVATVPDYAYERAVLYELVPPPIAASQVVTVAGDFQEAAWFGGDWLAIDRAGRLEVSRNGPAGTILQQAWEAHAGAPLRDVCVSPDASRVGLLDRNNVLHVYERRGQTWETFSLRGDNTRSPSWVDVRYLVFVEGRGRVKALDTNDGNVFDIAVADIPDTTPAVAVAARGEGGGNIAITYLRGNTERPAERAIATVRWPKKVPDETVHLELALDWGTLVSLFDDRVAWLPGREQLIISAAILLYDGQEHVGNVGRLSIIQRDGQARRLTYHDAHVRAPQALPGSMAGTDLGTQVRLLVLGDAGSLQLTDLPLAATVIPQVEVLSQPQLRP